MATFLYCCTQKAATRGGEQDVQIMHQLKKLMGKAEMVEKGRGSHCSSSSETWWESLNCGSNWM